MSNDTRPAARARARHLQPHATFGDDPSGYCGCAECDPRDDCGCRSCGAMTPTGFLLARITEDEADADHVVWHNGSLVFTPYRDRVLAECESKRRIIEVHHDGNSGLYPGSDPFCATCTDTDGLDNPGWPCPTLAALAAVYADHPDYRDEWRP